MARASGEGSYFEVDIVLPKHTFDFHRSNRLACLASTSSMRTVSPESAPVVSVTRREQGMPAYCKRVASA